MLHCRQPPGLKGARSRVHLHRGEGIPAGDRAVRQLQDAAVGLHLDRLGSKASEEHTLRMVETAVAAVVRREKPLDTPCGCSDWPRLHEMQ